MIFKTCYDQEIGVKEGSPIRVPQSSPVKKLKPIFAKVDPSIVEVNQAKSKLSQEQILDIQNVLTLNKLTKNLESYEIA